MDEESRSPFKPRKVGGPTPTDLTRFERLAVKIASLWGLGRVPVVSGTLGALAAIPVWLGLSFLPLPVYGACLALFAAIGIAVAGHFDRIHGTKDDPRIIIDEFVGILITMAGGARTVGSVLAGLILFGVLDILKPPPLRQIDRYVPGGLGVMGDDMAAGLLAGILLWVVRWVGWV